MCPYDAATDRGVEEGDRFDRHIAAWRDWTMSSELEVQSMTTVPSSTPSATAIITEANCVDVRWHGKARDD